MDNFFDLDFDTPEEQTNEIISECSLYSTLIKQGFVFSDKPDGTGAAYIMPDGKFLFLEQNREFFNTAKITHGALDFYLIQNKLIKNTEASRVLCQTDNAIRINDGSNFSFEVLVGLPKNKLTYDQLDALESWLYNLISKHKFYVSVGNELVSEVFQRYNLKEQLPETVINKIKTYYNNGILREAKEIKKDK